MTLAGHEHAMQCLIRLVYADALQWHWYVSFHLLSALLIIAMYVMYPIITNLHKRDLMALVFSLGSNEYLLSCVFYDNYFIFHKC